MNSSFYGQPRPEVSRAWVRADAAGLRVLGEAVPEVHAPECSEAALGDLPDATPEALSELSRVTEADVARFKGGLDPLAAARQARRAARAVSSELPRHAGAREYLAWLLRAFRDYPIAVELRHRSWSDASADTLQLLNAFGAAWVQIDEPKFEFSIRQN